MKDEKETRANPAIHYHYFGNCCWWVYFFLWNSVKETADKMHDNVTLKNHLAPELTNSHPQPISILLLGVDERKNDVLILQWF
jgi:hypothetical protein